MSDRIASSTHFGIGDLPDSHRATVEREMPNSRERPVCERPANFRSAIRVSGVKAASRLSSRSHREGCLCSELGREFLVDERGCFELRGESVELLGREDQVRKLVSEVGGCDCHLGFSYVCAERNVSP
jgi:hypothetical protein